MREIAHWGRGNTQNSQSETYKSRAMHGPVSRPARDCCEIDLPHGARFVVSGGNGGRGLYGRLVRRNVRVAIGAGRGSAWIGRGNFELLAQGVLEFFANVLVFLEEKSRIFAALAHALAAKAEPCAGLFDNTLVHAEVEQITFAGDAFTVENVEFCFAEGRGDFVLHDFGASARADDPVAVLDGLDAADVHSHGGIEFQRAAAGGSFRIAEHHADFFANLVDEDEAGLRFRNNGGELT